MFFEEIVNAYYRGGPWVMSLIFFVFTISVTLIFERFFRLFFVYSMGKSEGFLSSIQNLVMSDKIEEAIRLCKQMEAKSLPYVLGEGLKRANDSQEEMEYAIESATRMVLPSMGRYLPFLGTAANTSTLLGLLGTIFGLIKSFSAAAEATGAQKQELLAHGISEALTATSFGLMTALLCILAHGLLSMKHQSLVAEIHRSSSVLLDLLVTRKHHERSLV